MKVLTFTTLYPSAARPSHGTFVETRLRQLLTSGEVQARVVAPVPWFPWMTAQFGRYADYARVPHQDVRNGIEVVYPRYPLIPKVGMTVAPFLMAVSVAPLVRRILREYPFDLIDAHYFYPDGVAAVMLGKYLDKPVVITARGTDVSLIPQYWLPRTMIQWAARNAAGIVTVCRALKDTLTRLDVPGDRIEVLRNGVDLQLFRPLDRQACRRRLGFNRRTLLSVGHLIQRKANDLTIRALTLLPETDLILVGDGPQRTALDALAERCGVADRVKFAGIKTQEELLEYYNAADALVLASDREGWANVLLESMACGTPVVASNIWGTPEVVAGPEAGVLMNERTPEALAQAVRCLFAGLPERSATRLYAERFSWASTTTGQLRLFNRICAAGVMMRDTRAQA